MIVARKKMHVISRLRASSRVLSFNMTIFGKFHFLNSIQIQISHRARIKPFAKYPKTHFPKGTTEAIILGQPVLPLDVEEVLCGAVSTDSHDSLFVVVRSGKKGQIADERMERSHDPNSVGGFVWGTSLWEAAEDGFSLGSTRASCSAVRACQFQSDGNAMSRKRFLYPGPRLFSHSVSHHTEYLMCHPFRIRSKTILCSRFSVDLNVLCPFLQFCLSRMGMHSSFRPGYLKSGSEPGRGFSKMAFHLNC